MADMLRPQEITTPDFSHPFRRDSGEEAAKSTDVVGVKQGYDHDSCPAVHGVQVAVELLIVVLKEGHGNKREGGREGGGGGSDRLLWTAVQRVV